MPQGANDCGRLQNSALIMASVGLLTKCLSIYYERKNGSKKDAHRRHPIHLIILFKFKGVAERRQWSSAASKEPLNNSLCSVPTRCISRNLPLVKMISAQNSHYLSAFLLLFLKKGRLPPVSGYGEFSPGHGKRIQIGTSEHGVQSVLVFLQTTIHGFPVAELTLDDPERVLYFAAHR